MKYFNRAQLFSLRKSMYKHYSICTVVDCAIDFVLALIESRYINSLNSEYHGEIDKSSLNSNVDLLIRGTNLLNWRKFLFQSFDNRRNFVI